MEAGNIDQNYRYEALYESSGPAPDFHRLSKFQPIDFKYLLPDNKASELSATWKTAIAEAKVRKTCHHLIWSVQFYPILGWQEDATGRESGV